MCSYIELNHRRTQNTAEEETKYHIQFMKEARYYVGNHIKSPFFSGLITCEYEHTFLTYLFSTRQHNMVPSVYSFSCFTQAFYQIFYHFHSTRTSYVVIYCLERASFYFKASNKNIDCESYMDRRYSL